MATFPSLCGHSNLLFVVVGSVVFVRCEHCNRVGQVPMRGSAANEFTEQAARDSLAAKNKLTVEG